MSLWLAISAGVLFCAAALAESVRSTRATRYPSPASLALLAAAALAFSVAALANRENKPAGPTPAPASYFDNGTGDGYFGGP
jgi:uncharacterized membrane protein AbrB (regulator of aidB expression)